MKELFTVPVTFAGKQASRITQTSATITYDIAETDANAKAVLFFGENDGTAHIRPDNFKPAIPPDVKS